MPSPRLVLVDGTDLALRAYDALPSTLRADDGRPCNVLVGFARMFRHLFVGRPVTHGLVVFDTGGVRHRRRLPDDLRGQIDRLPTLIERHGFSCWEGDPWSTMRTLCDTASTQGATVTLVGRGDALFGLLTRSNIRVFDAIREVTFDADRARRTGHALSDPPQPADDVPDWADLRVPPPTPASLNAVYRELGRVELLSAEAPSPIESYVLDTKESVFAALVNTCCTGSPVAFHALVEPDDERTLVGVGLSPRAGLAFFVPRSQVPSLARWMAATEFPKIVHDARAAWLVFPELANVVGDTQLASFDLDPTRCLPHTLDQVARFTLRRGLQPLKAMVGSGRTRRRLGDLTPDRIGAYATHLAEAIGGCWRHLELDLLLHDRLGPHRDVDLPLAAVRASMQRTGVRVDPRPLHELTDVLVAERRELEAQIHRHAGRTFAVGSVKQLGQVLFEELGLPVRTRTKTGYSTNAETLNALVEHHPIVPLVQRWRSTAGLIDSATTVLIDAVDPETGHIHPRWDATASASGRMLSTRPDVQRSPLHGDRAAPVRRAFVARESHTLLIADWSQIELRVLAHLSRDQALCEAFHRGDDLHARTASHLFDTDTLTPEQRAIGKAVNFATVYGQGARSLSVQLGIPYRRAQSFIDRFFDLWPGVATWRDRTVARAHVDGFVTTIHGRRRQLPELSTRTPADRAHGERIAINTPVQGSVVDLCKRAMLTWSRSSRDLRADLVLQIHDELVVDVHRDDVISASVALCSAMEDTPQLVVPTPVSWTIRPTWGP